MPSNRAARLVARHPLGGPYVRLTFEHPEVARAARAGQFVMIKAGLSAEPPLRRPFSILSIDPAGATFDHCAAISDRRSARRTVRRSDTGGPPRAPIKRGSATPGAGEEDA